MNQQNHKDAKPGSPAGKFALIAGGAVSVLAVLAFLFFPKGNSTPSRPPLTMTMVSLPPVLTLPPPPPPEQKVDELKKDEVPVADPNNAPAPDDDAMKASEGNGDSFGLKGSKTGKGFGTGGRWGWYTSQMQASIQDALQKNPKTRNAGLRITLKIWPDDSGTIERIELTSSSGDAALDEVLRTQVFTNLKLQPPPADMPKPITLRITGRSPT